MKIAGALIRVSTAKQLEGTSPEKQLERILSLASQQGFQVVEENIWMLAESGASRDRTGFREALQAGHNGLVSRIYVYNIDRLGRDLLEMLLFLRQLDDLNIECWAAEKAEQLQGDDFLVQILGAVASKERQEIIKRTQDGLYRSIKAGKYSGGIIAYGYRLNPETKILEIQNNEADVVRKMFDWCIQERLSCVQIAERLNAMGVPTHYEKDGRRIQRKGKREPEKTAGIWSAGRVRNMLRNPAYYGKWEWGKRSKKRKSIDTISGYCPPIISEDAFVKVGEILHSNRLFFLENKHRDYLLRGVIKCGICGKTFCGSYSRVGPGGSKEKSYYRCNGHTQWRKLGTPKCDCPTLDAEALEAVAWDDIKTFCKDPSVAIEQLRAQHKPFDDTIDVRINDVAKQITELKRQEINFLKIAAESHEVSTDALDTVLCENRKAQEALVSYRAWLESEKIKAGSFEVDLLNVAERLARLGDRINHATFEERRRAVMELVKDILVVPERIDGKLVPLVTITYRFNEPCPTITLPEPTVIIDHTPARVAIMVSW